MVIKTSKVLKVFDSLESGTFFESAHSVTPYSPKGFAKFLLFCAKIQSPFFSLFVGKTTTSAFPTEVVKR